MFSRSRSHETNCPVRFLCKGKRAGHNVRARSTCPGKTVRAETTGPRLADWLAARAGWLQGWLAGMAVERKREGGRGRESGWMAWSTLARYAGARSCFNSGAKGDYLSIHARVRLLIGGGRDVGGRPSLCLIY